jgi:hypothetical protein
VNRFAGWPRKATCMKDIAGKTKGAASSMAKDSERGVHWFYWMAQEGHPHEGRTSLYEHQLQRHAREGFLSEEFGMVIPWDCFWWEFSL